MSLILAISGPAAVGKTTVCDRLIAEFGDALRRLVTATTRPPRKSEKNGEDYYFFNLSEFNQKLSKNEFLEHEIIHGYKYGILKKPILDAQSKGINILINIDVNGAESLRNFCAQKKQLTGSLKTIFIKPSNLEDLKARMVNRASETESQVQTRLANAKAEILRQDEFDYIIESADKETDYDKIRQIYVDLIGISLR